MEIHQDQKTVVLIPCHNEQITIGRVIDDFQQQLPSATIYVFDNCSTDGTAAIANEHGAVVINEPRKGKGFVVESMFSQRFFTLGGRFWRRLWLLTRASRWGIC